MPNDDDFFKATEDALNGGSSEEQDSGIEKVEKLKIGDGEYTQEELEQLVGLGKTARDLEDKWSTKIDRLYPEYTKKTQEVAELRKQIDSSKSVEVSKRAEAGEELTPEEIQAQAIQEARKLGIVTKDDLQTYVEDYYVNRRAAEKMLDDIESINKDAEETGKPKVNSADLLQYMQDEGIRNPKSAYKLMNEDALRDWERKQLNNIKPTGLYTESRSSAGSKAPTPVKVTKDNLDALVAEALNG